MYKLLTASLLTTVLLTSFSCRSRLTPDTPFAETEQPAPPNYENLDFWAAHPEKDDYADQTPGELVKDRQEDAPADVFFLHPTTFDSKKSWNQHLDDRKVNKRTEKLPIRHQASIFNGAGRVYAPRYRQGTYGAFFIENKMEQYQVFNLAYSDVKEAFEYYLEHENNGRPIIIAGHSQGSAHAVRLLREFFDGKPLQHRLVAAYVAGWPVKADTFSTIRPCTSPGQTGCFASWGTYRWDNMPESERAKWYEDAVVINPITWTTDTSYVSPKEHKGMVYRDFKKIRPHVCDAKTKECGVIWTHKPEIPLAPLLNAKNYHIADYNLYWLDVRENARLRVEKYLELQETASKEE